MLLDLYIQDSSNQCASFHFFDCTCEITGFAFVPSVISKIKIKSCFNDYDNMFEY
jgi:hypothetical protein